VLSEELLKRKGAKLRFLSNLKYLTTMKNPPDGFLIMSWNPSPTLPVNSSEQLIIIGSGLWSVCDPLVPYLGIPGAIS